MMQHLEQARAQLQLLVSSSAGPGYIEMMAGRAVLDDHGQPTDEIKLLVWTREMSDAERAATPHTRDWFYLDPERPDLIDRAVEYAAQLCDEWGNVYISRTLYRSKKHRDPALAIPNRLILVEDAQIGDAGTFALYVRTSATKGHGYVLADRAPKNATEYDEYARRLQAHYPGADASGVDVTQLVRLAGTYNTKNGARFPVKLLHSRAQQITTLDHIRANYPLPAGYSPYAPRERQAAYDAANWVNLPDGAALHQSSRIRGVYRRGNLQQLLFQRERVKTYRKDGSVDTSDSAQRAVFVNNLITASPYNGPIEHLPENEVRSLALVWQPLLGKGISDSEYRAAIDDAIVFYRPHDYQPVATRYLAGQPAQSRKEETHAPPSATTPSPDGIYSVARAPRGRAGNHAALVERVYTLLRDLRIGVEALVTTGELAASLGIDRRTITEVLKELREAGRIRTRRAGQYAGLVVTFSDGIYSPSVEPVLPAPAPQNDVLAMPPIEETDRAGYVSSQCEHDPISDREPPPVVELNTTTTTAPPALCDLAEHYLSQRPKAVGKRCVNPKTGLISYRRTAQHFADLVVADYGQYYTSDAAIGAYQDEQQRRKDLARQEWDRFFARLREMTNADLIAYVAGRCSAEVQELARDGNTFDRHTFKTRLKHAKLEMTRRRLDMPSRETEIARAARADADRAARALANRKPKKQRPIACEPVRYEQPPVVESTPTGTPASLIAALYRKRQEAAHV